MPDRCNDSRVQATGRDKEVPVELSPVVAEALDSALALAASRPSEDQTEALYGRLEAEVEALEKALSSTAGVASR